MTTVSCPSGHPSVSTDYCDVCGLPIGAAATTGRRAGARTGRRGAGAGAAPAAQTLPELLGAGGHGRLVLRELRLRLHHRHHAAAGLVTRPRRTPPPVPPAPAAVADWVVERWVDPDWYAVQQSDDPCPSPGLPVVIPLTEKSVLIGRPSRSRGIPPEIDCGDDTGVSRRQAQLTTDGQRWWVEDLQSSNGTYVGRRPLPEDPIVPGQRQELDRRPRLRRRLDPLVVRNPEESRPGLSSRPKPGLRI